MTLPSELEPTLFNPLADIREYLEEYHAGRYLIINLSTNPEGQYSDAEFRNRVSRIPIKPGWCPTHEQMSIFCSMVQKHLDAHSENVVAVHCDRGTSRTGMMIASWLVYRYREIIPQAAVQFFNYMRTDWRKTKKIKNVKGVTSPSQVRAVEDFYFFVNTPGTGSMKKKKYCMESIDIGPLVPSNEHNQKNQTWTCVLHHRITKEEEEAQGSSTQLHNVDVADTFT